MRGVTQVSATGIRRRAGAMTVVVGVVMGAVVATTGAALAATNYQIGTFNMAGGHKTHGKAGDEAPDALVKSVKSRNPAFITLQEVCRDWAKRLDDQLDNYTVKFDPVQKSRNGPIVRCEHPADFGNAILYRDNFGIDNPEDQIGHPLTKRDEDEKLEQREMLCVRAEAKKIVVCSLHLSVKDKPEARSAEAKEAKHILASDYAGYVKFVGGDLNDTPLSAVTDNFYHRDYGHGADGEFKEVDSLCGDDMKESLPGFGNLPCRSGETTSDDWSFGEDRPVGGRKIDFIFVSPSVKVRSGDATTGKHSDHDLLWADVTF